MSREQDIVFFRTFSIILLVLFLFAITVGIIAHLLVEDVHVKERDALTEQRTAPIGGVNIAGQEPTVTEVAPAAAPSATPGPATGQPAAIAAAGETDPLARGKAVYDQVCFACHANAVMGAPKFGDATDWGARHKQGIDILFEHAIKGMQGSKGMMPPKGGRADLPDDDVKDAVVYMLHGAGIEEAGALPAAAAPASAAATPATPAAEAPAAPAPAPAAETAAAPAGQEPPASTAGEDPQLAKGKHVYETTCMICHGQGVAGAPRFGDKEAWSPRVATGLETLHEHAMKGFMGNAGFMPPKGGNGSLSDDDVMAAVDYMVKAAQ